MLYGKDDVCIDDLTYKVNRFYIPLWARVGVGTSGRTIIFAIGIVKDESNESMEFIHSNFISAMNG